MNRLHLDFTLVTSDERQEYVNHYLNPDSDNPFAQRYNTKNTPFPFPHTPTQPELETIANYVLYGKAKSNSSFDLHDKKGNDGKYSLVDAGYIDIPTRNSPWNRKTEDSLDSLVSDSAESGNPIETQYNLIGNLTGANTAPRLRTKTPKVSFNREACRKALADDNPKLLEQFESLWKNIDETEYTVSCYDLRTGKRKAPIREELEERLTEEQKANAFERCTHLNMYTHSKLRKHLVELRQQQYTMRDMYAQPRMHSLPYYYSAPEDTFSITHVLPCGIRDNITKKFFISEVEDTHFDSEYQSALCKYLKGIDKLEGSTKFDFRDPDTIAELAYLLPEIQIQLAETQSWEQRELIQQFLDTYEYYVSISKLNDIQKDILEYKSLLWKNDDIAKKINEDYNKTYSANYISTIYRSKCCTGVADAAIAHYTLLENLLLERTVFKQCNTCKRILLRSNEYFVKKTRASDGLAGRCKACDKAARDAKKSS